MKKSNEGEGELKELVVTLLYLLSFSFLLLVQQVTKNWWLKITSMYFMLDTGLGVIHLKRDV